MKTTRKIIEIDEERCDGCGQCVIACAEGALEIIDGKARLVADIYCDGLGACIGECPQDALHIIDREAEEFDPEAVEAFLEAKKKEVPASPPAGCPSARLQSFPAAPPMAAAEEAAAGDSALSHWPVQVRLVPPSAPFLREADLLIAADCAPVAYPHFHRDFLQGKKVLIGCPKFDPLDDYLQKFTDILRTAKPRSVTVLSMEVPCCSALPAVVRKAMEASGEPIPLEEVVISARGDILERRQVAA